MHYYGVLFDHVEKKCCGWDTFYKEFDKDQAHEYHNKIITSDTVVGNDGLS